MTQRNSTKRAVMLEYRRAEQRARNARSNGFTPSPLGQRKLMRIMRAKDAFGQYGKSIRWFSTPRWFCFGWKLWSCPMHVTKGWRVPTLDEVRARQ